MKKFALFIFLLSWVGTANAGNPNPFMGNNQNQVALNWGYGVDSGFLLAPPVRFVPFNFIHVQYSQPTTFFKLPARQSLNVAQTLGFGKKYMWNWEKFTIPIMFASEDVALLHWGHWYYATGAGVGFQAQQNARIGSKLLFTFKISTGYRFTDYMTGEVFMQHFSNGNTAKENHSYAFYGVGLAYNF